MAEEVTEIKIFISCPDELAPEKDLIQAICEDLTEGFSKTKNTRLKTICFKKGVVSLITGEGAQSIINDQMEDYDYDIYIGILWKYFGVKQKNGLTPTEEEFEIAYNRFLTTGRPIIQFYFKLESFYPNNTSDANQAFQVQKFKEQRIKPLGLYSGFQDKEELRSNITRSLVHIIEKFNFLKVSTTKIPKIKYAEVPQYLARKVYLTKEYNSANKFLLKDEFTEDLTSVIQQRKLIVLLGDAGAGKTTELMRVASYFSKEECSLYPIFISLNKYVQSLVELLPPDWNDIPENQLLLTLDGLDEIESKNRNDFIRQIELFVEQHPTSHVCISSRTNFYRSETPQSSGTLNKFYSYTLLNLSSEEIEKYIEMSFGK